MYRLPEHLQGPLESAATIVTADARQAFAVRAAWGEQQRHRGRITWPTPDILPLSAWLTRSWSRALDGDAGADLPLLLHPVQERSLWEQVVTTSARELELLHPHGAAGAARRTWQRLHEWAIDQRALEAVGSEETRAFLAWAWQATRLMRDHDWIDAPRALWRCPLVETGGGAGSFMLLGFDIEAPTRRALLTRLAAAGAAIRQAPNRATVGSATKLGCADPDAELRAAAGWARRRLEREPTSRLLIAIPDLDERRAQVERAFGDVLDPGSLLVNSPARAAPFVLEENVALDRYPIVATALTAFALAAGRLGFDGLSHWLRSPYWLAGNARAAHRARLDVLLRRIAPAELDLHALIAALTSLSRQDEAATLAVTLRRFDDELRHPALTPVEWSAVFSRALKVLGWPGDRTLDSAEFQTVEKFQEALSELAGLERLLGRVNLATAVGVLARLLEQMPFQPESADPPITVTSRIGDPVLIYDGIWVSGLHAGAWPEPPRPDPFIPWSVQVAAGIPDASSRGVLERARRTLAGWIASAPEVILSWPQRLDDEDCDPSPLIATLPDAPASLTGTTRRYSHLIHASACLEHLVDENAPPLAPEDRVHGGARALRLQSLCPFRAFAEQRLGAAPLEQPEPGIDARARGRFIHRALEQLWSSLGGSERLRNSSPAEREALIEATVRAASRDVLERRRRWSAATVAIETERLRELLRQWLDLEAARGSFRVLAIERTVDCAIAGLALGFRIDRLDQLADGRQVLIDYKTGQAQVKHWSGERPEDPQMLLYAHALDTPPAALAYAVLSTEGCRFAGLSAPPAAIAGLDSPPDWTTQLAQWRAVIEQLASAFVAGRAAVDPQPKACANCHLHALCRIDEMTARMTGEAGDA